MTEEVLAARVRAFVATRGEAEAVQALGVDVKTVARAGCGMNIYPATVRRIVEALDRAASSPTTTPTTPAPSARPKPARTTSRRTARSAA